MKQPYDVPRAQSLWAICKVLDLIWAEENITLVVHNKEKGITPYSYGVRVSK